MHSVVCHTTINAHIPIDNIDVNNHDCRQLIVYLIIEIFTCNCVGVNTR